MRNVCMNLCMCVCMRVCTCACMHVCMRVCVFVEDVTHAYAHCTTDTDFLYAVSRILQYLIGRRKCRQGKHARIALAMSCIVDRKVEQQLAGKPSHKTFRFRWPLLFSIPPSSIIALLRGLWLPRAASFATLPASFRLDDGIAQFRETIKETCVGKQF